MKKKILGMVTLIVVVLTTGWNINQSDNTVDLSDVMLDNIEALAEGESSGEFESKTGCKAVLYTSTCKGDDGGIHIYAARR